MNFEEILFSRFIAELALNPARLDLFLKDREAAMENAGLSEEQKDVLRTNDFEKICKFLVPSRTKPIPGEQAGPGSGTAPVSSGGPGQ
jgi:hypothetical protein